MAEPTETAPLSSHQPSTSRNSNDDALKQPFQVPSFSYPPAYANGEFQMFPIMYPTLVPSLQNQEQTNRGVGLYAVPSPSYMGPIAGLPPNTLIPLTYNIPTRASPEAGAAGDLGQGRQQQPVAPAPQRPVVVRRFQIAFQLDLFLILKLAAVIFLFNQEGSRQRLVVLVFFASLIYLYQTGALAPLVRWLSQSMQRAAAPPRPPRPAVRAENGPAAARQNEHVAVAGGQPEAENGNRPAEDGNPVIENEENENVGIGEHGGGNGGNNWWGIVKEIQMIVFGFITSLLPGFHNID